MTARLLYEGVLIELNKDNAPNLILEDFNYFANKAVNNYVNKRYNIYDINQQTTDDLRVLKSTAILKPHKVESYDGLTMAGKGKMATYEVIMPSDYLHILNCICVYKVNKTYKCYNAGDTWRSPATRLTADMYSQVLDNFWNKPTYKRPYYYIHNVNSIQDRSFNERATIPTNPYERVNYGLTIPMYLLIGESKVLYAYYKELLYYFKNISNEYILYDVNDLQESDDDIETVSEAIGLEEINYLFTIGNKTFNLKNSKNNVTCFSSELHFNNFIANPPSCDGRGTDINLVNSYNNYHKIPNGYNETSNFLYGVDGPGNVIVQGKGFPDTVTINIGGTPVEISNRERGLGIRYGNTTQVRLEIRYGTDNSVFELINVYVDYIKAPQFIRLTQEELDLTEDYSQMLEYPDYVCQEIINELVHLIMENLSDQRLQTHPVVSQSIANPTQQLTPEAAGQTA